ncbi:MAG: hypothetical protein OEY14_14390, partial [Myxococcales bacterium]|nr:hypothetical protein [Myxococcales bacterium]
MIGAALGSSLALGCGGSQGVLEPRFVAVHNTMTAMGLAQTGSINEGSLPNGADSRLEIELDGGGCYTFVALGSSTVDNIDLSVLDEAEEVIGRDSTHD